MKLHITRLPSDHREYSVVTTSGDSYGVNDSELSRWLLNLGVDGEIVASILDIEPNQTTTLQAEKAA